MTISKTQIDAALATGVESVEQADRKTKFRSVDDMLRLRSISDREGAVKRTRGINILASREN